MNPASLSTSTTRGYGTSIGQVSAYSASTYSTTFNTSSPFASFGVSSSILSLLNKKVAITPVAVLTVTCDKGTASPSTPSYTILGEFPKVPKPPPSSSLIDTSSRPRLRVVYGSWIPPRPSDVRTLCAPISIGGYDACRTDARPLRKPSRPRLVGFRFT